MSQFKIVFENLRAVLFQLEFGTTTRRIEKEKRKMGRLTLPERRRMMDLPIPPRWKRLWDTWDLRGFIILSLSLQTVLILLAPLRKRTSSNWIIMPIWSAYLLADWAANFAVGLISNSQGTSTGAGDNGDLLAFWAPFLLVHLGGPDTITAFALEDNELWLRHLLGLIFQCIAAVYVFVQSLPSDKIWIPTMLMFMTGIIKYAERTRALYLASADRFKDSMLTKADPGPNYAKLMDEYFSKKVANLPTRIEMIPEPDRAAKSANKAKKGRLTEAEVIQYGYQFYKTFKGLIVDLIFSRRERNQSRDFFLNRTPQDAFRVIEVELNFIYDVLFTKLSVVYGALGALSRFFSLATICSAIGLFIHQKKNGYHPTDVRITYSLLFGALTLDLIALIMLLFSDWTIVAIRDSPDDEAKSRFTGLRDWLLWLMTESWFQKSRFKSLAQSFYRMWPIRILTRRWSESVSTYNLIYYCLHKRSRVQEKIYGFLGLSGFLDSIKYVKVKKFQDDYRDFIFEELRAKSELADDMETAKEICSARGDWVLRVEAGWSSLLPYTADVDYDQSLLLWHIATELCYNQELKAMEQENKEKEKEKKPQNKMYREFSKLLSDYMLYLLIMQPKMMSAIAGIGQIRFRDTCAEAEKFFDTEKGYREKAKGESGKSKRQESDDKKQDLEQIKASLEILAVNTEVKPVTVKGDRSKSVLFDGCRLAKELKDLDDKSKKLEGKNRRLDKWVIMSKVWLELLCYAATHVRANTHAQQVSKGGELITMVWLLMAHFGLGDQFQINEGQARAKLIVGK